MANRSTEAREAVWSVVTAATPCMPTTLDRPNSINSNSSMALAVDTTLVTEVDTTERRFRGGRRTAHQRSDISEGERGGRHVLYSR
jgi:hypothetical protein